MTRIRPRTKPRRGVIRDAEYREWILGLPCLVSVDRTLRGAVICSGRVTGHHDKRHPGDPKNDRRMIPLCEAHHLHDFGKWSIERIGRKKFQTLYCIDLEREINRLNNKHANLVMYGLEE